mmetsp:Transcript_40931/g.96047  ORF Transcript_40931/g.96047 Transcript_40931/m.96047 type:complete len:279 (-) Transcript_40931:939-1775(-)
MFRYCLVPLIFSFANGFTSIPAPSLSQRKNLKNSRAAPLGLVFDVDTVNEISAARAAFVLCFFGAAGSAAVGRSVIPKTLDAWKATNSLRGINPSSGGEELGLFGYPEPVYREDILKVLENPLDPKEIVDDYPLEGNIRAQQGYLVFEAFSQANADINQMAVRAVFDSIVLGINKNQVSPNRAREKLESFKKDLSNLQQANSQAKLLGFSAFFILLGIIGAADWFAFYHLWHGWFPEWPGLDHLPSSLFSQETGLTALPKYFIADVPDPSFGDSFPMP